MDTLKFLAQIFPKKAKIELIQTDAGDTLFAINDVLKLWKSKEGYIPVLTLLLNNQVSLKKVVVDMGAIKFVTNGADIMRPGITKIDRSIKKGDIIEIVDEIHDRSLAVGKAMYDADELHQKTKKRVSNGKKRFRESCNKSAHDSRFGLGI